MSSGKSLLGIVIVPDRKARGWRWMVGVRISHNEFSVLESGVAGTRSAARAAARRECARLKASDEAWCRSEVRKIKRSPRNGVYRAIAAAARRIWAYGGPKREQEGAEGSAGTEGEA